MQILDLNEFQRKIIMQLIQDGKELPENFKDVLFPAKPKEYELIYAKKMSKENILANEDGVFPVPLQIEKVFNGDEYETFDDGWKNMIVFGDNLQFMKTIYENKDPLIKDKIKGKVKLIYIDPPFATINEFKNRNGAKAYNDKKKGAEFVEFLRRRLILARSILAEDGCVFVHLDQKKSHYIKILMDEVFGVQFFINEIIWSYKSGGSSKNYFSKKHDNILMYSKTKEYVFNTIKEKSYNREFKPYNFKNIKEFKDEIGWYTEINMRDVWNINMLGRTSSERIGYPTQKPEKLLERIIKASSNKGDIILDFFGGSGTTMAVAEKLDRRWITCDIGKLAYFTMQKRILQIQDSKDLEKLKIKYSKKAKKFMTCRVGCYDLKTTFEMTWNEYKKFVAGLFEVELNSHKISGLEFDGNKEGYPVKIWNYNKYKDSNVDEAYLKSIHQSIAGKVLQRVYLIVPINNIGFITDYYEIDGIRYYFLKIPHQIIKELHKKPFQKLRQPQSKKHVNDLDETIGFHFIRPPEVISELKKSEDKINIVIKEFRSKYSQDEDGKILDNFEALSGIFVDRNFDGKQFIMTDSYFADELLLKKKSKKQEDENIREELKKIQNEGLKIFFKRSEVGKQIMVVYSDIYGNDFTEILFV